LGLTYPIGMKAVIGLLKEKKAKRIIVSDMSGIEHVKLLGGMVQAAEAEKILRNDLAAIWDDRVLGRAFELFGGVPRLRFVEANSGVPTELRRRADNNDCHSRIKFNYTERSSKRCNFLILCRWVEFCS